MKNILSNLGAGIFMVVVIVASLLIVDYVRTDNSILLGGSYGPVFLDSLTSSATTTGNFIGTTPVKVLDGDPGRVYAIFTNPSDTALYLYVVGSRELSVIGDATSTFPAGAATSTITALDGIYLAAAGGTWESNDTNLVTGYVYASTSAETETLKLINVSYK